MAITLKISAECANDTDKSRIFDPEFPLELTGKMSRADWATAIGELNAVLAEKQVGPAIYLVCFCCCLPCLLELGKHNNEVWDRLATKVGEINRRFAKDDIRWQLWARGDKGWEKLFNCWLQVEFLPAGSIANVSVTNIQVHLPSGSSESAVAAAVSAAAAYKEGGAYKSQKGGANVGEIAFDEPLLKKSCSSCGTAVPTGVKFCSGCGWQQ